MSYFADACTFVEELELSPGWNDIHLEELINLGKSWVEDGLEKSEFPELFEPLNLAKQLADQSGMLKKDKNPIILSVKATAEGVAEVIYGNSIWAVAGEDGELTGEFALAFGMDGVPVKIEGTTATIGKLTGQLKISETKNAGRVYLKAAVAILFGKTLVDLPFILLEREQLKGVTEGHLLAAAADGTFHTFCRTKTTGGGGGYHDMRRIMPGEYPVKWIEEQEEHEEYGRSWLLTIGHPDGDFYLNSRGNKLNSQLAVTARMMQTLLKKGKAWRLLLQSQIPITDKDGKETGVQVIAAVMRGEASANRIPPHPNTVTPELKSADPDAVPALKSAAVPADVDLVDMPF